jgi:quercetin dioxygenase-like cupin family protein
MKISNIPSKEIIKGFNGRFVHRDSFTIGYWEVEKGSILPEHAHIHEQVTQITKGKMEMTIDGKTVICEPGQTFVIPSNVVHSGKALTYCEITDVFCPVREDYK